MVTSAEANAFPGQPAGRHRALHAAANVPEVEPAARLDRLEMVRIFDYGLARHRRTRGARRGRRSGAAR